MPASIRALALFITISAVITAMRSAAAPSPAGFDAALATLRAERAAVATTGATVEHMTAMNEAFFDAVDVRALGPRELAELVRLNPFSYGERARSLARELVESLRDSAAAPDETGALAALVRMRLASPAGLDGPQREADRQSFVEHPALPGLLHGEFGDLALSAACDAAKKGSPAQERVLAFVDLLDAERGGSAAEAVGSFWNFITRCVPQGERREMLRQKLVAYLAPVLAREAPEARSERSRDYLERTLARLEGPEARGELLGAAAPEIHFDWVSRGDWRTLSELRGKVVVLEFWATWCGPCVEAFPKVAQLVQRFEGYPVEVIGVTSLQGAIIGLRSGGTVNCKGDPEKEKRLMAQYIEERGITWPVAFSRESVFNPAYGIEGIPHVVIIAPDGTTRHRANGLRLDDAVARVDALLEEFDLPRPAAAAAVGASE
jgi:thiol-disulfide isomerase/thioredoxin